MSWQGEMTIILRTLVNDMVPTYTYADSKLEQILVVSAQLLQKEIDFDSTYTIDIEELTITPDPSSPKDDVFINLVCLKAACLVLGGETKLLAAQSFRVEDAGAVLDVKDAYKATKELYDKYCEDFARAKVFYMCGNLNGIKAILTPTTVQTNPTGLIFG